MKSDSILEKELSYKIYGVFLKVGKEYGTFQREQLYHKAVEEQLKIMKINFFSRPKIDIISKITNKKIDYFIPDLVIEGR